jgi:polynucleotide 5'-hydroxyl-kinase GRC3/NOL9
LRYLLPADKTLIVRGQATLALLNGEAGILGSPLNKLTKIFVNQEKQLPVESRRETEVEITLGETGAIREIEGSSVPRSWKDVVDSLETIHQGTAMIIGPADVGKSTLCTYAMNELLNRRTKVRVIDADVGQADIGPPTTIASSTPNIPTPTLSGLDPDRMFFVGHTSPGSVESKVFYGIKRMLNSDCNMLTIINTDGWILDSEAIVYKNQLISTVQPDIVIGIGPKNSLRPLLDTTKSRWILAETSRAILPRTRSDRKEIRKSGYRRFLDGSTVHTLRLNDVKMQLRKNIRHALSTRSSELHNVLVGFLDDEGFMHQIGILETMVDDYLRIYCKTMHKTTILELGHVKLSRDGSELGFLE